MLAAERCVCDLLSVLIRTLSFFLITETVFLIAELIIAKTVSQRQSEKAAASIFLINLADAVND